MINLMFFLGGGLPGLGGLVAGLSPWKSGLNPRPLYEEFVVKKVSMEHGFLRVLLYFSFSHIPPMVYTHSSITDAIYPQPMIVSLTNTLYKFIRTLPSEKMESKQETTCSSSTNTHNVHQMLTCIVSPRLFL